MSLIVNQVKKNSVRLEDSSDDRGGEEAEAQEGEGETGEEEGSTGGTFGFSVESAKGKLTLSITYFFLFYIRKIFLRC